MDSATAVKAALFTMALLLVSAAPRSSFAQTAVDTEIVLAVDVSDSVSYPRFILQRRGYAKAFRNPEVLNAIRAAGPNKAIAVAMFQWTGYSLQRLIVGWTLVNDEESAGILANEIEAGRRRLFRGGTSVSGAIDASVTLFKRSPFTASREVLDVSGDGANNNGPPAAEARDKAVAGGIIINGLPILSVEPHLDLWYKNNVVGGEGSFMISVDDVDSFGDAIVKKLINEIAGRDPMRSPLQRTAARP